MGGALNLRGRARGLFGCGVFVPLAPFLTALLILVFDFAASAS